MAPRKKPKTPSTAPHEAVELPEGIDLEAVERRFVAEQTRRQTENRLAYYKPYPKQMVFHGAGASVRERLLRAGNQNGKTWAGGFEAAMHLTGRYPDWWVGRRFDKPIIMWAAGVTGETTRDNPQRVLIGNVGELGTGTIPTKDIISTAAAHGVSDLLDYVKVRHVSGGQSTVRFKYYEQGRRKWQGPPLDVLWLDEEPPQEIYDEGLARTIATGGFLYLTFTPLLGMSEVVRRFLTERSSDRHDTNMTIDDAEHIPAEERARIIASFPAHEREARARGTPILGSGRIFPISEDLLKCEPREFPDHWPRIGGMDFGWTHAFAACEVVWDREGDTIYVNRTHRMSEATPVVHAAALRPWGKLKMVLAA
jgi:phage terminase large subunit-like protein